MKTTSRLREFSAQGFLLASGLRMLSVIPATAPSQRAGIAAAVNLCTKTAGAGAPVLSACRGQTEGSHLFAIANEQHVAG
jgi:hypothetical protein